MKIKIGKKYIFIGIVILLIGLVWFGIDYCLYSPSPVNKYIASNFYKTPANSAFNDDNFYQCVVDNYNRENKTSIGYTTSLSDSQLENIKKLYCNKKEISSVSGIEKITNLIDLELYKNKIENIDVSNNKKIQTMLLAGNNINNIDISNNINLLSLNLGGSCHYLEGYASDCGGNFLSKLDVSKNVLLTNLSVSNNKLSSLDLSNNSSLEELKVNDNQLTNLNLNGATALTEVYVEKNQLTSLDLSNNLSLTELYATRNKLQTVNLDQVAVLENLDVSLNQLTELNLNKVTSLKKILVNNNKISSLNLDNNLELIELNIGSNQLTSLDISNNLLLEILSLSNNRLIGLDISNNSKLTKLNLHQNELVSLNLNGATSLSELSLGNNQLTELDVSNNLLLTDLNVKSNKLVNLDVSNNKQLKTLDISKNNLVSLIVDNNSLLKGLYAGENKLTSLDLEGFTSLSILMVGDNQLTSLDLSKNSELSILDINNNPFKIKLKPMFKGTVITSEFINENKLVKLPSQLVPVVTRKLSDGLSNTDNGILIDNVGIQNYIDENKIGNYNYNETYEFEVVNVESSVYEIDTNKDYIYIGADSYEESLNKIEVMNGELSLDEDYLVVKNGEDEVKRFKLIRLKSSFYNLDNDYIYVSDDSNEVVINNIETNANINIDDNNILNISYSDYNKSYTLVRLDTKYDIGEGYIYTLDEDYIDNITIINGSKELNDYQLNIKFEDEVIKAYDIVKLSSEEYDLTNDYIYTKTKDFDISKVSVTKGNLVIEDNVLKIKHNDILVESYDIVSISSNKFNFDNEYILNGSGPIDLAAINVVNGVAIEEDNKLKIKYGEEVLDIYEKSAFVDQNFYNCVVDNYNYEYGREKMEYNKHLNDEQLAAITSLYCNKKEINNANGLEKMTKLNNLELAGNNLKNIDVSNNIDLLTLNLGGSCNYFGGGFSSNCGGNLLTELDISKNVLLTELQVSYNNLNNLYTNNNSSLTKLEAYSNQLIELDVSELPLLMNLKVDSNQLISLDISNNIMLTYLSAQKNQLMDLNLSGITSLEQLDVTNNQLMELDISNNSSLKILKVDYNKLTSLKMDGVTSLEQINAYGNQLINIDLDEAPSLKELYVNKNQLMELDLSNNLLLKKLEVYGNRLTSLKVDGVSSLEKITAYENQLIELDVSEVTDLKQLDIRENQLTELDISNNLKLTYLNVSKNKLTSLNASGTTSLQTLVANNNQLTELDVSNTPSLTSLYIYNNQFKRNLKPVLLGDIININENRIVKLPTQLVPYITMRLSDGLEETINGLIALKAGTHNYIFDNELNFSSIDNYADNYEETYEFEVVDITSNIYEIDKTKDYIYIGGDSYDEVINNIEVINGELFIDGDYLVVKNGEDEVKRFKLIGLKSSVYDLNNDYIYVSDAPDEEIINNIETNANVSVDENNILNISYGQYSKNYILVRIDTKYDIGGDYIYTLDTNFLDNFNVINGNKEIIDDNVVVSYNGIELDRLPILSITSDKYNIYKDHIYTGFKDIELKYINKTNVELDKKDNKLVIKYKNTIIDEIPYYYITVDSEMVRKVSRGIYIVDKLEYNVFNSLIEVHGIDKKLSYKIYNSTMEEIIDSNISDGFKFKVLYQDEVIEEWDIKIKKNYVDYLEEVDYEFTEDETIDIIKGITLGKSFIDVRTLIETNGQFNILDKKDQVLEETNGVKTGDKFVVSFDDYNHVIHLSVKGDVTGRGNIDQEDVDRSYQYLRGNIELEYLYKLASDVTGDGEVKINDISKLYQYTKKKIESLES